MSNWIWMRRGGRLRESAIVTPPTDPENPGPGLTFADIAGIGLGDGAWPYAPLWGRSDWRYVGSGKSYDFMAPNGNDQIVKFRALKGDITPLDTGLIPERYRAEITGNNVLRSAAAGQLVVSMAYTPTALPNTWSNNIWTLRDVEYNGPSVKLEDWRGSKLSISIAGGEAGTRVQRLLWQGPRLPEGRTVNIVMRIVQHPSAGELDLWVNGALCVSARNVPIGSGLSPQAYERFGAYIWNKKDAVWPSLEMGAAAFEAIVSNYESAMGPAGDDILGRVTTPLAIPSAIAAVYPLGSYVVSSGVRFLTDGGVPPLTFTPAETLTGNLLLNIQPTLTHDPATSTLALHTWDEDTNTLRLRGTDASYGSLAMWAIPCTPGSSYQIAGDMTGGSMGIRVGSTPGNTDLVGTPAQFLGIGRQVGVSWTVPAGVTTMYVRLDRLTSSSTASYAGVEVQEIAVSAGISEFGPTMEFTPSTVFTLGT